MPNKSSPHGAAIVEGSISEGTLRTQDLLRACADALDRHFPFNGAALAREARAAAAHMDKTDEVHDDNASDILSDCYDQLQTVAARDDFYFGAHEGDGACIGFWRDSEDA